MLFQGWGVLFCFHQCPLAQVDDLFPHISYGIILEQFPERYAEHSSFFEPLVSLLLGPLDFDLKRTMKVTHTPVM